MTDTATPTYVFLDTQVYDAVGLNFAARDFIRLVEYVSAGHIQLVSTTVTEQEVQTHLAERAAQTITAIAKAARLASATAIVPDSVHSRLDCIEDAQVQSDMTTAYGSFQKAVAPELVSVEQVDVADILEQYFAKEPPFGEGKKKSEFPDAIAASALQQWCQKHSRHLHVVSDDRDWKELCEATDCFTHHTRLIEVFKLFPDPDASARIIAALKRKLATVEEAVAELFPNRTFFLDEVDGEVLDVGVDDVECQAYHVVKLAGTSATVDIDCKVEFSADITYKDPDSWIYDSEDKVAIYMDTVKTEIQRDWEVTVEVEVSFPKDNEHTLEIESTEMSNDYFGLSAQEYEY